MVFILDGASELDANVWIKIGNLIAYIDINRWILHFLRVADRFLSYHLLKLPSFGLLVQKKARGDAHARAQTYIWSIFA